MNFVFKPSPNVLKKIIGYYKPLTTNNSVPYAMFQAKDADTVITVYESGKVMFQGVSADIDAYRWFEEERILNNRNVFQEMKEKKQKKEKVDKEIVKYYYNQSVGSDEVGTGDYFGPIVVTAAYVTKNDRDLLNILGVTDSKLLTDQKVLEIAPKLIKSIPHEIQILSNEKYNQLKDTNLNKIKAILHNEAISKLIKNNNLENIKIIVDKFASEKNYYNYLLDEVDVIKNIIFMEKADLKVESVSVGAIISRYAFLKEMEKLNNFYNTKFPLGAGEQVDRFGKELVKKEGIEILQLVSKYNFKNTQKILD